MPHRTLRWAAAAIALTAAPSAAQTVSGSFDQTYAGPQNTQATNGSLASSVRTARGDAFTLADLGPGGFAILSSRILINPQAAATLPQLGINAIGFLRNVDASGTPSLFEARYDDDPLLYFQPNDGAGPGTGFCINSEFNRNGGFGGGDFVFGMGANYKCGVPNDNATQTATAPGLFGNYTMRLNADGTFLGTLQLLDADGDPLVNVAGIQGGVNPLTISGTVADLGASYTPFLRLRPGFNTGNGLGAGQEQLPWQFDVTNSAFERTQASVVPEPATVALTAVGLAGLVAAARRRRASA